MGTFQRESPSGDGGGYGRKDFKEGHYKTNLSNATNFPNLYVGMYICRTCV